MTQEIMQSQDEIEVQETLVPQSETESFKRPSRVRKAVTGVLGGLALTVATNAYDLVASIHNDRVRDARAQRARIFDLETAEVVPVINVDENGNEIPEEGVPVAMNE